MMRNLMIAILLACGLATAGPGPASAAPCSPCVLPDDPVPNGPRVAVITVYTRQNGPVPIVSIRDYSKYVPGSFLGTPVGNAVYRGRLNDRPWRFGYRYQFSGRNLIGGHTYLVSATRSGSSIASFVSFDAKGRSPWFWTISQSPKSPGPIIH